jgi:hypothetical protein
MQSKHECLLLDMFENCRLNSPLSLAALPKNNRERYLFTNSVYYSQHQNIHEVFLRISFPQWAFLVRFVVDPLYRNWLYVLWNGMVAIHSVSFYEHWQRDDIGWEESKVY